MDRTVKFIHYVLQLNDVKEDRMCLSQFDTTLARAKILAVQIASTHFDVFQPFANV